MCKYILHECNITREWAIISTDSETLYVVNPTDVCLVNTFYWRIFLLKLFFNNILYSFQLNIPCLKVPSRFFFSVFPMKTWRFLTKIKSPTFNAVETRKTFFVLFGNDYDVIKELRRYDIWVKITFGTWNGKRETCAPSSVHSGNVGLYMPFGKASVIVRFDLETLDLATESVDFVLSLSICFDLAGLSARYFLVKNINFVKERMFEQYCKKGERSSILNFH